MKAGTQLGPYRVESLIGAGGMGEVYRATDTRLERSVAIKMLPAHLSANSARGDQAEVGTPQHLFDINPVEMTPPFFAWNGDLIMERIAPGTRTKSGIEVTTAWRAKLK
jgi:serine/threonine protein kinase